MSEFMEYQIIASKDIKDLVNTVNAEMIKGWVAQGGVTVRSLGRYEAEIVQAMIKLDKPTK